ncbi:hypothetical protein JL722_8933 [Aureococcus anophagefferens]|nr:hypothetical protein JL722_8933 [Aureococcus anophagefferens]
MASGSVCRNYLVTVTCAFTSLYFLRQQPLLSRTLAVEGGLLDCGSCAAEARERAVRRAFAASGLARDALARLWRHGGGLGAPALRALRGGRRRKRRRAAAAAAAADAARAAAVAAGASSAARRAPPRDAANEIWRNARGGGGAGGGNATDVDAWAAEALEGGGALDLLGDMVCFGGEADVAAAAELVYYVAERSPAARRRLLETATARARRRERETGGALGAALYAAPEPGWSKRDEERVYALNAAAHLAWVLAHRLHGDLDGAPEASRRADAIPGGVAASRRSRSPRCRRRAAATSSARGSALLAAPKPAPGEPSLDGYDFEVATTLFASYAYASSRADAARPSVAEALGLDNGANVADVDEALTVATASDVSQFLGDVAAATETLFELYVIAVFEPAARHGLLGLAAALSWWRVGVPWLVFVFVPVFCASMLPIWLYMGIWLLACCVVPTWLVGILVKNLADAADAADAAAGEDAADAADDRGPRRRPSARGGAPRRWTARRRREGAAAECAEVLRASLTCVGLFAVVCLGAPALAVFTVSYLVALHGFLGALAVRSAAVSGAVGARGLGHAANLAFLAFLLEPARDGHARFAARLQIVAALAPLRRTAASLRHWATRRAVPKLDPAPGDLCPVCHEVFGEEDEAMAVAHCRWGCGRAVHDECIRAWMQRSDSCVLCGAKWS